MSKFNLRLLIFKSLWLKGEREELKEQLVKVPLHERLQREEKPQR